MPMRTYRVAMMDGSEMTRRAHIVSFARDGQPPVTLALYKTSGGYAADHPRTGRALRALRPAL